METIDISEFPMLVEAVRLWTGWEKNQTPRRDDSLLVEHFGEETASRLRPILKSLESDFYSSDAWKIAADIHEMGELAAKHFRNKHPEIPDEIVRALTWCYTFDYK